MAQKRIEEQIKRQLAAEQEDDELGASGYTNDSYEDETGSASPEEDPPQDDDDDASDPDEEDEESLFDSDDIIVLKLRVDGGEETRLLEIPYSVWRYDDVVKAIVSAKLGAVKTAKNIVSIKYMDEDDELATIKSDVEVRAAWRLHERSGADKLVLEIASSAGNAARKQSTASTTALPNISSSFNSTTAGGDAVRRPSASSFHSSVSRGGGPASSVGRITVEDLAGWKAGSLLGKGAYGSVYRALLRNGLMVAAKVVDLGQGQEAAKAAAIFEQEMVLMRTFHHPNVVQYYGCERNDKERKVTIFMQYCPEGSLGNLVGKFGGSLPPTTVGHYTAGILSGLNYLHSRDVIHRDIKPDNVLVDGEGVRLADFGASKQLGDAAQGSGNGAAAQTMVGTPYYMAPEVITNENSGYGASADIWSVGCTVVEMLTGRPPWPEFSSPWNAVFAIANSEGPPPNIPQDLHPEILSFLDLCFNREPSKRPSARDLLNHPFVANPDCVATAETLEEGITRSASIRMPSINAGRASISAQGA